MQSISRSTDFDRITAVKLPPGLYEALITKDVAAAVQALEAMDPETSELGLRQRRLARAMAASSVVTRSD
jgi:hypothetical protein